jgi:hypothetical protein
MKLMRGNWKVMRKFRGDLMLDSVDMQRQRRKKHAGSGCCDAKISIACSCENCVHFPTFSGLGSLQHMETFTDDIIDLFAKNIYRRRIKSSCKL